MYKMLISNFDQTAVSGHHHYPHGQTQDTSTQQSHAEIIELAVFPYRDREVLVFFNFSGRFFYNEYARSALSYTLYDPSEQLYPVFFFKLSVLKRKDLL